MKRQRGLGLLEFAVAAIIVGVLAGVLLSRLLAMAEEAERQEVQQTLRNIDLGMTLALRGDMARVPALLVASPLDFLAAGGQDAGAAQDGRWRYDAARRQLAYRPRHPAAFDGRTELLWRYDASRDAGGRTTGLHLEPMEPSETGARSPPESGPVATSQLKPTGFQP